MCIVDHKLNGENVEIVRRRHMANIIMGGGDDEETKKTVGRYISIHGDEGEEEEGEVGTE